MAKNRAKETFSALLNENDSLKYLLEECENGCAIKHLSSKQYNELWTLVAAGINVHLPKAPDDTAFILQSLSLIENTLKADTIVASSCNSFIKCLAGLFENAQSISDSKTLNALCKIGELWLAKKDLTVVPGMGIFVFRHLFSLNTAVEKPLGQNLKRLYSMRCSVEVQLFEDHQAIINKLVQNSNVVNTDTGQKLIGFIAGLSENLFRTIFKTIALELSSCSKKTATSFGKILTMAWFNSSEDLRPQIQGRLQGLMEEFIKLSRTSLELPKRSSNVMYVIDILNLEARKKGNNAFITMITECYQPILWKYLHSGINFQRCNAADLFLKAFPLQLPGDPDAESELFVTQLEHMESALRDDCHIVRIIAVREICNILAVYWTQFSSAQIHKLMTVITKEDAADTSSAEVRRTVWRGLECFVHSEPAFAYLQKILPNLNIYIHDVNQNVRIAFIQLLISIRDKKDPNYKFTDAISRSTLLKMLANEKLAVGRWIVKLLMPLLYQPGMEQPQWILRFSTLINKYPNSYRNFFMYSNKILPFEDAHFIMRELITYLGGYVTKKLQANDNENDENCSGTANSSKKGKASKRKMDETRQTDTSNATNTSTCAFDVPAVVTGIFDIITILWVLHDGTLTKLENKDNRTRLLDTYIQFAQSFISYYKGSKLFNSVVTLSGNVPMPLLTANSITLPGYCMKMLKTMQMERNQEENDENLSMLVALIKWGCGSQLLEQVSLWLDSAFKSVDEQSSEKAGRKVKIVEVIQPNSLLAVHILNTVLSTEHTKVAILRKNYSQLLELWNEMGVIKDIIYRRLLRGRAYSEPLLSDEFLQCCFLRYVKLIPLLHRPNTEEDMVVNENETRFNAQEEMSAMLQWLHDDLIPLLHSDVEECNDLQLMVKLVNDVLYVCDNMLIIHLLDESMHHKVGQIIISLLTFEHNLYFVKAASRMATALNYSTKLRSKGDASDDLRVWTIIVPSLLSHTLNAMVSRSHSADVIDQFKEDFQAVKINVSKILATYEDNFKIRSKSKESLRCLQLLVEKMLLAVRVVLGREVPRDDMSVPTYSTLASMPPVAAAVLAPLYNKEFWTPMFLVVLKLQLGRSIKTLLIDILILHLFGKIENKKWMVPIQTTLDAAVDRLKQFKYRRESGEVRTLGITLSHVDTVTSSQEQDVGSSQERLSSAANLASRGSELISNVATMATESEVSEPLSQMTLKDSEIRGSQLSQPTSLNGVKTQLSQFSDQMLGEPRSSQPESNMATMGSQPLSSQTQPQPCLAQMPEEELIDDFINCGEELLDTVKSLLAKRAALVD